LGYIFDVWQCIELANIAPFQELTIGEVKKILSPFLRSRLVGGEGRGNFKTRTVISAVAADNS
jgi:hypothetical protein